MALRDIRAHCKKELKPTRRSLKHPGLGCADAMCIFQPAPAVPFSALCKWALGVTPVHALMPQNTDISDPSVTLPSHRVINKATALANRDNSPRDYPFVCLLSITVVMIPWEEAPLAGPWGRFTVEGTKGWADEGVGVSVWAGSDLLCILPPTPQLQP